MGGGGVGLVSSSLGWINEGPGCHESWTIREIIIFAVSVGESIKAFWKYHAYWPLALDAVHLPTLDSSDSQGCVLCLVLGNAPPISMFSLQPPLLKAHSKKANKIACYRYWMRLTDMTESVVLLLHNALGKSRQRHNDPQYSDRLFFASAGFSYKWELTWHEGNTDTTSSSRGLHLFNCRTRQDYGGRPSEGSEDGGRWS